MKDFEPKPIKIGSRLVGPGHSSYIVAEIGINHNGDMLLAKKQIDAAKESGADAVKFQNFDVDDFLSKRDNADLDLEYKQYNSDGSRLEVVKENQYDLFKRVEISRDDLFELKEHSDKVGIDMHSTPTNKQGIQDLVDIGVDVLKNGSDYLPHVDLIRAMGETGLPTVVSAGMATVADIYHAAQAFYETGNDKLIILHCVSSYPASPNQLNLARMKAIQNTFGCLTGFSDHSEGFLAAALSSMMGACWIEKHFTSDKKLPGPDHWFSADLKEFRQLVNAVREGEKMYGRSTLMLSAAEKSSRLLYRISCVASRKLVKGYVLGPDDITYQRPGTGIEPRSAYLLFGRTLNKTVERGHPFSIENDFFI